jgi:hypothetical protein
MRTSGFRPLKPGGRKLSSFFSLFLSKRSLFRPEGDGGSVPQNAVMVMVIRRPRAAVDLDALLFILLHCCCFVNAVVTTPLFT